MGVQKNPITSAVYEPTASISLESRVLRPIAMAKVIGWPPIDFLRVIADADALYVEHLNQKTA